MLKIFNAKKKNVDVYINIPPKKSNNVGVTRHYPPASKE